ncbi:MAG TPA: PAS domain S-box protein [Alphaproteobacteria bacterium]|nr:PAS domain S-box protein [Alphaproteobacteria bacterium]
MARAWFTAITNSSFDAIIGLTPEGRIKSWNPAAERIYGHSADAAIGRHISFVLPPERVGEIPAMPVGNLSGQRTEALEAVHIGQDGQPIDVSVMVSPVPATDGTTVGFTMIARDVTDARWAMRDLEESRARLAAALLASEAGTFRWHVEADRLEWDDDLKRLFGLAPEAEIRRIGDFLERVHPDDRAALVSEVERCLAERTPLAKEFRIVHPDGSVRWIADKAQASYDEAGRPVYLTGACSDVTDRKEVEAKLSAAFAAKEALLQQKDVLLKEVNHRVKNSLQLVSSLLSLQSYSIDAPEIREQFNEACSRVAMVAAVHERLYRTSRARSVEFGPYLHQMCGDVASAAVFGRARRITVQAVDVEIDTDRAIPLALIINELLTNALKYAYSEDQDGEVRVVSELDDDGRLRVCVEDDGVGFPSDFDPATSNGLGMKLVRALVAQLDGELVVRRDAPGACLELFV